MQALTLPAQGGVAVSCRRFGVAGTLPCRSDWVANCLSACFDAVPLCMLLCTVGFPSCSAQVQLLGKKGAFGGSLEFTITGTEGLSGGLLLSLLVLVLYYHFHCFIIAPFCSLHCRVCLHRGLVCSYDPF